MADSTKHKVNLDADLAEWLAIDSDDTRELIVEAIVPRRTVQLSSGTSRPTIPTRVESDKGEDRAHILEELHDYLKDQLNGHANLLHVAGAVAVRANQNQLRQIMRHPRVKAVRQNRKLR